MLKKQLHFIPCRLENLSFLGLCLHDISLLNKKIGEAGTSWPLLTRNAAAVKLFTKDCPKADRVNELAAKGVAFKLCANALRAQQLQKEDMLAACIIVPAGVVELVRLQDAGHAYVKP